MKNLMVFENFVQNIGEAEKGLMHKLLNVPDADKISSKYSSGKKLADDLVNALATSKIVPRKDIKKKAASMLAFAANWPSDGKNSVMDKALRAVRNIGEAEVVIADEPQAEGPNEKLYVETGNDREMIKKKIKNKAIAEKYPYETGKRKLTGTDGSNPPYTLKVVMSKVLPE
jgi:hypothetical protein